MRSITVRNIPPETLRALQVRALRAGRSTEAEVRAILGSKVQCRVKPHRFDQRAEKATKSVEVKEPLALCHLPGSR